MKLKKVLSGLVLFGATLALVACGNDAAKTDKSSSEASSSVATKVADLKDGTYTGESDYDERGWKVVHTITVKDGKITESAFGYENEAGDVKAEDEEYNKNMKDKAGVSSKEATEQLNTALVEKQDLSAVEVVSGATNDSNNFVKATEALLAAAAEGKTDPVTIELGQ